MEKFTPKYQEVVSPYTALAMQDAVRTIDSINKDIQSLENRKTEVLQVLTADVEALSEDLYQIWYYTDENIGQNAGVNTILTKDEAMKFFKHYKDGGLYIVDIIDLPASLKAGKKILPFFIDFLPQYQPMILNPEYNDWHNQLLKNKEK